MDENASMPVYGHFRASGIRPDVYVGSAVLNFSLISGVSRPFTGVLLVQRPEARKRA